jgi:pimeloyl-ACP methyl ester carboxylesterase
MGHLHFSVHGSGSPVVLIHGFPMHSAVWESFAQKLSKKYKVYTPDLPGFGKSTTLEFPFTIDDVGKAIAVWLEENKIRGAALIGHSLGGYVALSVAKARPDLISKLGLFHSTAYADNAEKKESRNKVLEFIDKNGVETFTSNFIAPLFADPGHPAIATVRALAMQSNASSVKGYTQAMRDRPDRTDVLRNFASSILLIGGEKDAGISPQSLKEQASICKLPTLEILPNVAHMGMFENERQTLEIISKFIATSGVTS